MLCACDSWERRLSALVLGCGISMCGLTTGIATSRSTEDFSYFTLLRPGTENVPGTSLFGISCTRQMDASQLLVRPADVTRSTVQKAVVVIADSPQSFGMLRERLGIVTKAWFAQRNFSDIDILRHFQESLAEEKRRGLLNGEEDGDQYLGMSLREMVHEFRWQTLVLLKCCLLQPKVSLSEHTLLDCQYTADDANDP